MREGSVLYRSSRTDSTHDTERHLTTDEQHVDSLTADRDGDGETGDDADQTSDEPTLPRGRVPFDEALADDLTTEGNGERRRLAGHEKGDGEEVGEGCRSRASALGSSSSRNGDPPCPRYCLTSS